MIAFAQRFHIFLRFTDFPFAQSDFIVVGAFYHELLNASPFFYGSLHIVGSLNFLQKKNFSLRFAMFYDDNS